MDETRYQTRVGAVVLTVLLAAIVFTIVILPTLDIGRHIRIGVVFTDMGGVTAGSPVMVAGRKIGEVESVSLVPNVLSASVGSQADKSPGYSINATLALRQRDANRVFITSEFFVSSHGPLSSRYIEIAGRGQIEPGRTVVQGDVLRGIDPPSLDRVLQRTWNNLSVARQFLVDVSEPAQQFVGNLSSLGDQLDQMSPTVTGYIQMRPAIVELQSAFDDLAATAGGATTMTRLESLLASSGTTMLTLRRNLGEIDAQLEALQGNSQQGVVMLQAGGEKLVSKLRVVIADVTMLLDRAAPAMRNAQHLAATLARGEGSLQRIMTDPEFPEDSRELGKILKRTPWRVVGRPADEK